MNQSLTLKPSQIPTDLEFQMLQVIAKNAQASGLYSGIGGEAKIFMILLSAKELGIPPMQALNGGIWNIKGKIEISARLMSSMIRRAGHSLVVKQCDSTACIIEGRRFDTGDSFTAQFTIEDAKKARLIRDGGPWVTYTEDMLFARALSRLARRLFADVIGTAYVEGEIADARIIESHSEGIMQQRLTPLIENEEAQVEDLNDDELIAATDELAVKMSLTASEVRKYVDEIKARKEITYRQCFNELRLIESESIKKAYETWRKKQLP